MFKCVQCGNCCNNIKFIPKSFPYKINNGVCVMLKNNKCVVYENRPFICNIDKGYEVLNQIKPELTREEWYLENKKFCNSGERSN